MQIKQNLVVLAYFSITKILNNIILRRNANYAAAVIASASSKITNFIDVFLSFVNVNDWDSANPFIVSLTVLIPLSSDALSY